MKRNGLLVPPNARLKAIRSSDTRKPVATRPNQYWGIDMTKVMTQTGWAYVVVALDWYTKKVVGHYCGDQSKSWHWLVALNKGLQRQFPNGSREQNLKLISDNGCQPTSTSFMHACDDLGIEQIFTSYNNPKGNAETERFMRTLKEEKAWLQEWTSPTHLDEELAKWFEEFNETYLHSAIGNRPPNQAERDFRNPQNTLLENAC